jgi:hypothetical protein
VAEHGVTGREEVGGHRATHDSQPYEPNGRHAFSSTVAERR